MQQPTRTWSLFSSHGLSLFQAAANPAVTQRELSDALGLTERQVGRIVKDLRQADVLRVERRGRQNCYVVNPDAPLRHPTLAHIPLGSIIAAVVPALVDPTEQATAVEAAAPPAGEHPAT
ncbi:MAG: helix-turn-helix domain-containing protein [Chloroflexota bacterium]|nr:helix-turn-helix domain-containing protein [Chloroflexota bacterium]